jgi:zinc transport system substrate-binding protein
MTVFRRAVLVAAFALVAAACTRGHPEDDRPVVAVSVPPQAWIVDRLAAGRVRVNVMIPPGAEAHSYEPTLHDLSAVSDAVLYVEVGHPKFTFEQAWLDALLRDRRDMRIVDATAGVASNADDPHVWVAPSQVRPMARNIAAALEELLPAERAAIAGRLRDIEAEIDSLDRDIRRQFEGRRGRRFFVFHPAWSYFARDYGLVQVAIEREGHEPDPKTLARVVAEARAAGVDVIFIQPQQSSTSARLVAAEIGARTETIDPMAYEWSSNLRATAAKIAKGLVE